MVNIYLYKKKILYIIIINQIGLQVNYLINWNMPFFYYHYAWNFGLGTFIVRSFDSGFGLDYQNSIFKTTGKKYFDFSYSEYPYLMVLNCFISTVIEM